MGQERRAIWLDDPIIADAILDRILHCSHRIELKGPSLRKNEDHEDGRRAERGRPAIETAFAARSTPTRAIGARVISLMGLPLSTFRIDGRKSILVLRHR
jgi:hypothetical protein